MVDIQSAATEIRRGIKKEDRRQKSQGKNIMVCPITQGDHNKKGTAIGHKTTKKKLMTTTRQHA